MRKGQSTKKRVRSCRGWRRDSSSTDLREASEDRGDAAVWGNTMDVSGVEDGGLVVVDGDSEGRRG